MILVLHIVIAVVSVLFAAYGFLMPSKIKLRVTYVLIGATLASGTYLVVMAPAHMVQACTAGLFYTAIMIVATIAVRRRIIAMVADTTR